jgi:hypothetical protein
MVNNFRREGGEMPNINWLRLRAEYITSDISQRALAQKYNVSFNTLKTIANKEKWNGLRQQHNNNVTTKAEKKLEIVAEKQAAAVIDYNAEHLKAWSKVLEKVNALLDKGVDADSLQKLTSSLDRMQKGQRLALGQPTESTENSTTIGGKIDLSKLTDEELIVFEKLVGKIN